MADNLIERCKTGDKGAFEQLIMKYSDEIYTFSYFLMGSENEALFITEKIFSRLQKNIKSWNANFRISLYKLSAQMCLENLNRIGRLITYNLNEENETYYFSEDSINVKEMVISEPGKTQLRYAASSLPSDLKVVYFLKDCCGFNYDEISEILAVPKDDIQGKIARARRIILKKLESNSRIFTNINHSTKEVDS